IKFLTTPKVVKLFNHNRLAFNFYIGGYFVDFDDDGIKDNLDEYPVDGNEVGADTDLDKIPDFLDTDDDNDGMTDSFEDANGLNSFDASDASLDSDNDGLTNLEEYLAGSKPNHRWWVVLGGGGGGGQGGGG
ncbi:hypothetical protein, partial [Pseudoalteromonas spongiae]|uniref:hypothetical protein n=1 Tax=Pseudoalteromonas spongiae TaxID=298657 RepID=UPI00126FCF25